MEILIAIFILAIVLSTIFVSYTSTLTLIDETESQTEAYSMARVALERIQEDLESAFFFNEHETRMGELNLNRLARFVGENDELRGRSVDRLRFLSTSHLVLDQWSREFGFAEIVYSVKEGRNGEGFVLYRRDTPEVYKFPGEDEEGLVLCEDLYSFNLTYYDFGGDTYEAWNSTGEEFNNRLPSMVSVSLDIINKSRPESPFRFITGVTIPIAKVNNGRAS